MKLNLSQPYDLGDLVFYKPSIKSTFVYILFLVSKIEENTWWCGYFDHDSIWRESLIPENKMIKIND